MCRQMNILLVSLTFIILTPWFLPESVAAAELKAKDLGVYQRAGNKYELVATITADQDVKTQFSVQFGRVGTATTPGPITFDKKWYLRKDKERRIQFEVPGFHKNIGKIGDAWLVFREKQGWQHLAGKSGKIRYYPLDVKITALDDKVILTSSEEKSYIGRLRIHSTGRTSARFALAFVGGPRDGAHLWLPDGMGVAENRFSEGNSVLQIISRDLGKYLADFAALKLKYSIDGGKLRELTTVSGESLLVRLGAEPEEFHTRINVHITKVNGKAPLNKTVQTSLSEGGNGILTLKIITENYWSPFSARVEYKTDSDATFRPLDKIEIDGNIVELDMKFRWENTSRLVVRVTSDDPPLSDTASVNISAQPSGGRPGGGERWRSWMADNLLYIIIIGALMVIAAALLPKWWPMLIKPSTTESLEAEDVANDKEKPVAEVTAKYQGKTVPELHSQKAEPSPTANALGKFSKADEEAAEEYLVAKVLREIAIDDIILLDADSRYRFRITIPTDTEPIISEYPDWLDVSQPKRNNDKEWIIRLKSDKDFQELKFGTVEIEADGYNTKTFTVIHKPVPASPPPSQPSTIELRFGNVSKVIELPPGGNRSIEIEVENHKESALILDNEDSPGKITVYVPSSDIPSNVLLEQLKDRLVKVPDPREDLPHRQSRGEPRN